MQTNRKIKFKDNLSQVSPTFIALISDIKESEQGHHFVYNRSVQRSAELNGWKYVAAIPESLEISVLPTGWEKCLPLKPDLTMTNPFLIVRWFYLSITSIHRLLRKYTDSNFAIVFLEAFNPIFLLAFTIALFFLPREKLSVWLLFRREFKQFCLNSLLGKINWFLVKIINKLLYRNRLQLLSDSELLTKWFDAFFNQTIHLMPIPHTHETRVEPFTKKDGKIICWMAGHQYARSFNLSVIQRIANLTDKGASTIRLIVAESVNISSVSGGVEIDKVKDDVPRIEYLTWLFTCDIVLMPYDPLIFSKRTSGVFVECIIAGKIPVVTKGTWAANELEKFDLEDLIVDWDNPDILSILQKVAKDASIKSKLVNLRKAYLAFHNEKNFASSMKALFKSEFMLDS